MKNDLAFTSWWRRGGAQIVPLLVSKVAGKRLAMGLGRLDKYTLLNSASFTPQRSSGSRQVAKLRRHSGGMFGTQSVICGALFRHCHNVTANHSNHVQIFTCQANLHESCIFLLLNCKMSIEAIAF